MNVLLIYPTFPDTFWSFKHALRFIHKKASSPPLGLLTIAAMLPNDWHPMLIDLNVEELKESHIAWADLVFVSAMVVQRESTINVIDRCKKAGKIIVAGGPIFIGEMDNFPQVDHFVLNEGEITFPQFLADYLTGNPKHVYSTDEYADLSSTPTPAWELVKLGRYDSLSIQYSRGCPFSCDFCNITAMLGHRPRTKSASQIITELEKMYSLGWRRSIFFVDDNFIGNRRQLKDEILPALIQWRKGKKGCGFITEASINLADDPELMQMMTAAGFRSVFVGIETPDEASLAECNKSQNRKRNLIDSVHTLQQFGLQVMGGFIVGFDNDTPNIFQRQIDFIQKSGIVTAMVGMLQAPYGTKLYKRMEEEGRLLEEMNGDNADGTTNIVPRMGIDALKRGYKHLVNELYSPNQFYKRVKTFIALYNPPTNAALLQWTEIAAFFASIWRLGILGEERLEYWKLFFWALFRYPKKFALAITFSIYGHHFRTINEANNA